MGTLILVPTGVAADSTLLDDQTIDYSQKIVFTPEKAGKLMKDFGEGNPDAIAAVQNLDIFNADQVKAVLEGVKVTEAEGSREFCFDDGSSIVMSVTRTKMSKTRSYWTAYAQGTYQWKVGGICLAEYTMNSKMRCNSNGNTVTHLDCWDSAWAAPGFCQVANGCYLISPSAGHGLNYRGSGGFYSIAGAGETASFNFHT